MGVKVEEDKFMPANYISAGLRCGLSLRDTLQAPVGLVMDLWEIYKQSHGIKTDNDDD